jgi:type 1 fimbria pilin
MINSKLIPKLFALVVFISSGTWGATATCDPVNTYPTSVNQTSNIGSGSRTIGADMPVDTELMRVEFYRNTALVPWIACNPSSDGSTYNIRQFIALEGSAALVPGWTGKYAGALYQTTVNGIGFAILNKDGYGTGQAITTSPFLKWETPINTARFSFNYNHAFTLVFVKTGPISSGGINGASLPRVTVSAASDIPVTGLNTKPWTIQFTGTIPITNGTCNISSSPNVSMGKYPIENYFGNGRQNSTPWVPFNITLSGCESFIGNYSTGTGQFGAFVGYTGFQTNFLQVKLAPLHGVFDDAKGIMKLQQVAGSANGVGIQVAQDTGAADPIPFSFSSGFRQDVRTYSQVGLNVPMKARYVPAGNVPITPGLANSSVVFTINYN